MSAGIGRLLADAVRTDPTERRRSRLMAVAVAGAGAFALAGVAVLTMPFSVERQPLDPRLPDLAPFVAQSGLRPGVVLGAALLVLPFGAFAVQALRLGTAARERRLSALMLAGATRADLRRIAAVEGGRSGLVGAMLVAPAYLLLWLLLGVLLPAGARMLPPLLGVQVLVWLALVPLLAATSALAAAWGVRAATVDPLGGPRRRVRPLSRAALWLPVLLLLPLFVAVVAARWIQFWGVGAVLWSLVVLLVAAAMAAGPPLVALSGRVTVRRRDPVSQIAGRRLLSDARTPGRVSGVLASAGLVVGVVTSLVSSVAGAGTEVANDGLALGALAAILLAAVFAMLVGTASLLVGATEQVLDTRRPTAVLAALGVAPERLREVLERQLVATAVVPAVAGVLGGWLLWAVLAVTGFGVIGSDSLLAVPLAALLVGGIAASGARLVARWLRGPLDEAMAVENLRAP
jgi:hypothetical protein